MDGKLTDDIGENYVLESIGPWKNVPTYLNQMPANWATFKELDALVRWRQLDEVVDLNGELRDELGPPPAHPDHTTRT